MLTERDRARSGGPRYPPPRMRSIDTETALALARAQGHDWVDRAAAERIAAGASAAVAAVVAALQNAPPGLLAADAADFLATLESLAEPGE